MIDCTVFWDFRRLRFVTVRTDALLTSGRTQEEALAAAKQIPDFDRVVADRKAIAAHLRQCADIEARHSGDGDHIGAEVDAEIARSLRAAADDIESGRYML